MTVLVVLLVFVLLVGGASAIMTIGILGRCIEYILETMMDITRKIFKIDKEE